MSFPRFSGLISISFLLDPEELKALLEHLGGFLVRVDKVVDSPIVSQEDFLKAYEIYWQNILQHKEQERSFLRQNFQVALTESLDNILFLPMKIAKALKPVIMIRPRPDLGLEALYPRIFQDGESGEIFSTFPAGTFRSTELFQKMQRYLRKHSLPQKNSPLRLGLQVKGSWIS